MTEQDSATPVASQDDSYITLAFIVGGILALSQIWQAVDIAREFDFGGRNLFSLFAAVLASLSQAAAMVVAMIIARSLFTGYYRPEDLAPAPGSTPPSTASAPTTDAEHSPAPRTPRSGAFSTGILSDPDE